MNEIDYAARVAKGVALLDEKRPGWEREIDLDTLDIENGTSCVTAQLSGTSAWYDGMYALDLTMRTYTEHGFRVDDGDQDDYATLNILWKALITTRLASQDAG